MKKKLLLPFLLLWVSGVAVATGCTDNNNSGNQENPVVLETMIEKDVIELSIYQEYWLQANYDGNETVVWTVEDSTVVSISEDKLIGLKEGSTTLTVTAGTYTDSCQVIVSNYDAEKFSLSLAETNMTLYKNDEKQILATIKYDGNVINPDVEKEFLSSHSSIVEVDSNGKLTAKQYGKATISVYYTFAGVELAQSINVDVISSGKVEIEQDNITLSAVGSYGEETYTNTAILSAKVYEKGVEKNSSSVVWSIQDDEIATINGGLLTAKNAGVTMVTASYLDEDGQTKTDTVVVTVSPIEVDTEKNLVLSKNEIASGYTVDLEDLIGDSNAILGAYVTVGELKTDLSYENEKFDFSTISAGERSLYVQTRNITYKIALQLWTATLETTEDMQLLWSATEGWYRLAGDVDILGLSWKYEQAVEFKGIFDGNNYTISGLNVENVGLFNILSGNAIVKNVTLKGRVNGTGAICAKIKENANVTIENVNVYADVCGTQSGGFIGNLIGQVTLKNVQGVVSRANNSDFNGAIFGIASNMPTMDNVKIYSSLSLCGKSSEDNSMAETLNALNGVVVQPTLTTEQKIIDFEESGDSSVNLAPNATYKSCTIYGNELRTISGANGTISVKGTDVEGRFGGSVDVLFEKEDGTLLYYAIPLSSTVYLNNANFTKYVKIAANTTQESHYILTEDVTLSGTWSSAANSYFSGVFDGDNYTIKGLNVGAAGGLFEYLKDATIKNVSIVDAYLGDQSGTFAYRCYGKVAFDNVYVSLAPQVFTAEKYLSGNDGLGKYKGGLFGRAMGSDGVTVKNCVVYMPENLSKPNGFVAGFTNVNVTVESSTFIGGNGLVCGIRAGYETKLNQDESTVICDAVKAYEYLYSNAIYDTTTAVGSLSQSNTLEWSDMQILAYKSNHPLVKLTNDNAATELKEGTNKDIIVLTDDIDLGSTWNSTQKFEGVLDGNGHAIKYAVTSRGGLVKWLHGSIKNVAIDAKAGDNLQNGLIAPFVTKSNAYMENVYVNTQLGSNRYNTPLFYWWQNENSVGMKNVVVLINESGHNDVRGAIVAMAENIKNEVNAENCYYIDTCGSKKPMATIQSSDSNASKIHAGNNMEALFGTEVNNADGSVSYLNGGLTGYTNYNTFYDAAYSTLSETVKKLLPAKASN